MVDLGRGADPARGHAHSAPGFLAQDRRPDGQPRPATGATHQNAPQRAGAAPARSSPFPRHRQRPRPPAARPHPAGRVADRGELPGWVAPTPRGVSPTPRGVTPTPRRVPPAGQCSKRSVFQPVSSNFPGDCMARGGGRGHPAINPIPLPFLYIGWNSKNIWNKRVSMRVSGRSYIRSIPLDFGVDWNNLAKFNRLHTPKGCANLPVASCVSTRASSEMFQSSSRRPFSPC
jgi:hypothetical protein